MNYHFPRRNAKILSNKAPGIITILLYHNIKKRNFTCLIYYVYTTDKNKTHYTNQINFNKS